MKNCESKLKQFSLQDIAAWHLEDMKTSSDVVAGIPSLQRGAVWDAQQVEMLWDSIFRNFPIGSIVLSAKIGEQSTKSSAIESHSQEVSHHILDGQQRTNAIAWGFNKNKLQKISEKVVQCLWLDLNPKRLSSKKDNSRHYFF